MTKQKVYEVLQWASSFLEKNDRDPHVAEVLMLHHLDVSYEQYIMMMRNEMSDEQYETYQHHVNSHVYSGVPVQHLTGYTHFYGHRFTVNENVLIPRFETEELVHHVITYVKEHYHDEPIRIVDVGTGSGAIAISLALALPQAKVYATDISPEALAVAKENAQDLQADVRFLEGDFLQPIIEAKIYPQIVVSNPPYIKESERGMLADTVRDYDPTLALFAERNGLAAYETIVAQMHQLETVEYICFEIGYTQAQDVTNIIKKTYPHSMVEKMLDMNKNDRIITAKIK